jgi:integrase
MRKHLAKNERIKRAYLAFLENAKGVSTATADHVAASIAAFEESTNGKDFAAFHIEQARRFKRVLAEQKSPGTGKPLSKSTIHSRLMAVKAFFQWLAGQSGYRRRIAYSDAEYFNLSANDERIAKAVREKPAPSIEKIRHVLFAMPTGTDIEKRDRAVIAFALLSGARDDAIASMAIRHVDLAARTVFHDARTVRTKRRKTYTSWFFPVGEDIEAIVRDWIAHLQGPLLFGPDDPLFPATAIGQDENKHFAAAGLSRSCWKDAGAIRRIFKEAFTSVRLPYYNPHSFRSTLALIGERICPNVEAFKAWSQNLAHGKVLTTLMSYGHVASHRQAEIFAGLRNAADKGGAGENEPDAATIEWVLNSLRKRVA